jgi:hypothetical protein
MKTLIFAFAVVASSLMSGLSAQAGVAINGSFGFGTGGIVFTPPTQANYNAFTGNTAVFTPTTVSGHTGDFVGGPNFFTGAQQVSFFMTSSVAPGSLSINFGNFGVFTGTLGSYGTLADNAFASYSGSFTPGSAFAGFDVATVASLNLAFSATGADPARSYNVSGTVSATGVAASAVPEPASMAIFGLGALGFAARRFRRK